MKASRLRLSVFVAVGLLAGLGLAGEAQANHVSCGQVITQSTVLDSNIGPCTGHGVVIGASGITLDLNGKTITGDNTRGHPGDGEDAGVRSEGMSNVVITHGIIQFFDAGVAIDGGSANEVKQVTARRNQSTGEGDFGDGIAIFASANNSIHNNFLSENGPFSGVSLIAITSTGNTVKDNVITRNTVPRLFGGHGVTTEETDGVRLEFSPSNLVEGNHITKNGLDGIGVFVRATDNIIRNNRIEDNGVDGTSRFGDGIHVFGRPDVPDFPFNADRTLIELNRVFHNGGNGIVIDSRSNHILNNMTGRNGTQDPGAVDLLDSNIDPDCDANAWRGNTFDTAIPDCTKG